MKKVCLLAVIASLLSVSTLHATVVRENFVTDPALDGWQVFGVTNLFQWDSTNQVLEVTWDSTQPNSYFYYLLGRTYTRADGFYLRFDLQVTNAVAYDYGDQLAIGLLHFSDATNSGFSRADETAPNTCEFDYFPAINYDGYAVADNVEATLIDETATNYFYDTDYLSLVPGVTYRVELLHRPGAGTITCDVATDGQIISTLPIESSYGAPIGDFQFDMLAVINFQDDGFGDSVFANGSVGNIAFASPLPTGLIQTPAPGQAQSESDTNWLYTLEQSQDLQNWAAAAPPVFGNGTNLLLQATNPPAGGTFYRIRADLP